MDKSVHPTSLPAVAPCASRLVPWNSVEHNCYKCNAPVEEGITFCPQCSAPLIRVSLPEAPDLSPAPSPVGITSGIQWSRALGPTAMAGFIASILMLFPLGAFGLGMILAGVLSVVFYRWRNPGT